MQVRFLPVPPNIEKEVIPVENVHPGYYAVIPADVRYDDRIPANAKLLYGEISALIGAEGFCYASNQYFAKIYGMADDTITRLISKLEKAGYIVRELERDSTGQIVKRKLFLNVSAPDEQPVGNLSGTLPDKKSGGTGQKVGDTNLSITNIEKENKKEKVSRKKAALLTDEQLHDYVISSIATIAAPDWSRDVKNELYRLVMALYDPEREVRKARPVRSEISVKATFRKLLLHSQGDPKVMLDMLYSAINGGWQGVQPPSGSMRPVPISESPSRKENEIWL